MKLMVIGNIGFDLMAPYLRTLGVETVLVSLTDDDFHARLADKAYFFPDHDDFKPLVAIALKEHVDAAVSISGPDRLNLRDSRAKEVLERDFAIPTVANPLNAVTIAINKLKTKEWLRLRGFPVTSGAAATTAAEARAIADELGYPVVMKLLDDSGGVGMRVADNSQDLARKARHFPILIEKYVAGLEFSVEVLNYGGRALPLLPVYKGFTHKEGVHPMERVKLAPAPLDAVDIAGLRGLARRIVTTLDLQPTADVDIVWGDSGPQVLEINPRFGGVTALSMAASGVPVYSTLVDMAMGRWDPLNYPIRRGYAADLPINRGMAPGDLFALLENEGIFRVKLQKLKKTAGRVALKADSPRRLLRSARLTAHLCDCDQDYYRELKELIALSIS